MGRLALREKILLIIIGGLALCFLFYYFILKSQIQAYAETRTKLEETQVELVKARAVVDSQKMEMMLAQKATQRLKEVVPYFYTEMQDGSALVQIGLKAIQNKIDITSFAYAPIVNKDFYLELPTKFTVKGQYRNFITFLRNMEDLPNLTEIRTLNIKPVDDEQEGVVEATFDLIVYSDPSPQARIRLAEMAKWALGRYNAFRSAFVVSPLPGVVVPGEKLTSQGIKSKEQKAGGISSGSQGLSNSEQTSSEISPRGVGESVYSSEVETEIPTLK